MTQIKEHTHKSPNLSYKDILPDIKKRTVKRAHILQEALVPSESRKKKKRVGRGRASGMGKTSSRGHNGQKSRSGYSRNFGFEGGQMPLYRRVPKRGFTNTRKKEYQIVNLEDLEKLIAKNPEKITITPEILEKKSLIHKKDSLIKILGRGTISKSVHITADACSKSAQTSIQKAGGSYQSRSLNKNSEQKQETTQEKTLNTLE